MGSSTAAAPSATSVLDLASQTFDEFARRLSFRPADAIPIAIEPRRGWPEWAAAVNDGVVRIAMPEASGLSPEFRRLFRHELAHSFVTARTGGNCPTWLQEGVSQWLEGSEGSAFHADPSIAIAARQGRLLSLRRLDAPFQGLDASELRLAYAESRAAVAYIAATAGEPAVLRLLEILGRGTPFETALREIAGMTYAAFERSWMKTARAEKTTRD